MHHTVLIIAILLLTFGTKPSYATSADTSCGIIWDEPILLTDSTFRSFSPQIALSGDDTIHITWAEDFADYRLPYIRGVTGGSSWEPIRDLIVDTVQFPAPMFQTRAVTDGGNVYVFAQRGRHPHNRNVMAKSTDMGSTWTVQYIAVDTVGGLYSTSVKDDTLVVHYQQTRNGLDVRPRLMYSIDGGATWHERPDTLKDNSQTALTHGTLHLAQHILLGSAPEIVYKRSLNLGETWQDSTVLSPVDGRFAFEMSMGSLATDSVQHIMLAWRDEIVCAAFVGCTVFERETRTNGLDWLGLHVLTDTPRGQDPSVAIGPTGVAAVSWTDEVALTQLHIVIRVRPNENSPWCPIVNLSPTSSNAGASCVVVGRRAIHVAWSEYFPGESFRIVYRRGRFIDTDVKEQPVTLPPYATLEQNYPNPFNPSTRIVYGVTSRESVSLKVFDVLGREVALLVNETREPGEHTVEWNPLTGSGQALPSGVYYYRLMAGDRVETKKAILLR